MKAVDAVMEWFSMRRRAAVYVSLGSLTVLLVALGRLTETEAEQWLDIGQKALAVLASIIALLRLTPDVVLPGEEYPHELVEDPDVPLAD